MSDDRDYYCRNKFTFLKIDVEQRSTYNCHAAAPHTIDMQWLQQNPGNLFNTDINVQERKLMLENKRNASCEQNCYRAEDLDQAGPRILEGGYVRTHFDPIATPEIIDINLTSECNLACSYCSKVFSTAWRQDLNKYGDYIGLDNSVRYKLTPIDKVISKLSQSEKKRSTQTGIILNEFALLSKTTKNIMITGGEPFLNNFLFESLDLIKHANEIKIFTGLGLSRGRFQAIINKLQNYPNVLVCVSAENLGALYEFNRNGAQWNDTCFMLDQLKKSTISTMIHSTLSCLTIHGFPEFLNQYVDWKLETDLVHVPTFMPLNVIDNMSKEKIINDLQKHEFKNKEYIISSLKIDPTEQQRQHLKSFLQQFSVRRSLNLNVFPKSFLKWVDIDVV
jgi:wyosine [tRNA(Phe)-imidazoG37] synthetase (radical SAM superfamily)